MQCSVRKTKFRGCNEDCLRRVAIRLCRLANDGHDDVLPDQATAPNDCTKAVVSCDSQGTVPSCCSPSIPEKGEIRSQDPEPEVLPCCAVVAAARKQCCETSKEDSVTTCTLTGQDQTETECSVQNAESCCSMAKLQLEADTNHSSALNPCCSTTNPGSLCIDTTRGDIGGSADNDCCTEAGPGAGNARKSHCDNDTPSKEATKAVIVRLEAPAEGCQSSVQKAAIDNRENNTTESWSECCPPIVSTAPVQSDCDKGCCSKNLAETSSFDAKIVSDTNSNIAKNSTKSCDNEAMTEYRDNFDVGRPGRSGCKDGCCNDTESDAASKSEVQTETEKGCVDDCCSISTQESGIPYGEVCSGHLQSVFERYQPLLQNGMCLCRRILGQLGFCCCSLSNTGSTRDLKACRTHTRPNNRRKITPDSSIDRHREIQTPTTAKARGVNPVTSRQGKGVKSPTAIERISLRVAGMTCTGCSTKLMNVLSRISGLTNAKVTFVSGMAEFDLDRTMSLEDTIARIESETGFKLSHVISGYQHLHVSLPPAVAQQLKNERLHGVVSLDKLRKSLYRITYDPLIIGARDLLSQDVELAPPSTDSRVKQDRKHLWHMALSFGISSILTIPVLVLTWSHNNVTESVKSVTNLVLGSLVQIIAIPNFYIPALRALVYSHVLEMDMLVVISISAAYIYSVTAFGLMESGVKLRQGAFFEASTLLVSLVLLGRLFSALARVRAVKAVSLRSLQADTALLTEPNNETTQIDARLLQFGDVFKVPAHAKVVTDGEVVSGESAVDESMVTGESMLITKQAGDEVIAGTVNDAGNLLVRLTRLPGQNSITDIAHLVENAMGDKPRLQSAADRVASYFVSGVICIALTVFLVWVAIAITVRHEDGAGAVGTAITYTIAVLVVSCPCALGLAIPMVLVIAGGLAAKAGVIVKAADAFETGSKISDVVFDKTGTLTMANLGVVHMQMFDSSLDSKSTLSLARALTDGNKHPVSAAVTAHLAEKELEQISLSSITSVPGCGIHAKWRASAVKAGNPYWLGIENHADVSSLLAQGMTLFCVMFEDDLTSVFGLKGSLREEACSVVAELRGHNITCHIVSGDSQIAVEQVAQAVGIDGENILYRSSPSQKQDYVRKLQNNGKTVLFCGDGTNDAVAVAQADIGTQIGSTSDVTGAVADVVLLGGLEGVMTLRNLSKRAFKRVWLNFAWAAVYNIFAILLAAGAFVKFKISPDFAGLGEIVSVAPIFIIAGSLALDW